MRWYLFAIWVIMLGVFLILEHVVYSIITMTNQFKWIGPTKRIKYPKVNNANNWEEYNNETILDRYRQSDVG